ncbi:hypothetical protein Naga_100015g42 [Nannochloropsis gaditana]|uniref:Uncharacterized protein n=1 Tax=Nannochloropsis gaditana TaxID=72520 RepID=W7TNG5_9STRA|nr:hypothetical protein Naga_100015g42 [Nannochloropsis gaditana]
MVHVRHLSGRQRDRFCAFSCAGEGQERRKEKNLSSDFQPEKQELPIISVDVVTVIVTRKSWHEFTLSFGDTTRRRNKRLREQSEESEDTKITFQIVYYYFDWLVVLSMSTF